ncbi:DNA-3-methyladenine glycosylase [Paenalcaligenes hominis]|uniref:DNA-3-methyladenine glycosylase family protein n=1 Tax=Paenalcaligenes hominis TaxID=643674 RepID=UPI0035246429
MSGLGLPSYWRSAQTQLMKSDRILRRIIPLHSDQGLTQTESPFVTMVRAIMAQQASRQTALNQWQRFADTYGNQPNPEKIAILSADCLRQIGLPKRKADYIIEVSTHFVNGHINMAHLANLDNEQVIQTLCKIRGVGRWTAEMFLIFNLRRADVLPLDDAALLKAISKHYFSGEPVSRFEAREVAQAWAPWCTVATWHLWRSLNAVAVHY